MRIAAFILSLCAWCSGAFAQAVNYPSRVITMVVGFPAGGATDVTARLIAEKLSEKFGQRVIVENRVGANGLIGTLAVANAAPDGYTLVMGGVNTHGMYDALVKSPRYDSLKSFTPITLTARIPIAFVVHPSLPAESLADLLRLAKERPGQFSYGSSGTGGPHHLAMELFKMQAGVNIQHVPYKGGAQQLNDLLGGHIKIGSIGLPPALPHIQTGILRALALTSGERSSFLPELPTVAESGLPGFGVNYWLGLLGPAGMPAPVVEKLNREVSEILDRPDVKASLAKQGVEPLTSTPSEFRTLIGEEIGRWRKVGEAAGLALE